MASNGSATWTEFQQAYGEQIQLRMRRLLVSWKRENNYDLETLEKARVAAIDEFLLGR